MTKPVEIEALRPFNKTPQGDICSPGDRFDVSEVRAGELELSGLARRTKPKGKAAPAPDNKMAPVAENKGRPPALPEKGDDAPKAIVSTNITRRSPAKLSGRD